MERMDRRAADNKYLHKDFHGSMSIGIAYLEKQFGEEAVREYLRRFTRTFYAPLREELTRRGLPALRDHFEKLYAVEESAAHIELQDDVLTVTVEQCPAVAHLRAHGYLVARLFHETTRTVNETLCESTPYQAELLAYDSQTGAGIQRFSRRNA